MLKQNAPPQVSRLIRSATALRLFYIPREMHDRLGLNDMYPKRIAGRRGNTCEVSLGMDSGAVCPVTMIKVNCKGHSV
jgi:hypothetical protein